MQPGSLVECIHFCSGTVLINGELKKAFPEIHIGEMFTISDLLDQYTDFGPTGNRMLVFIETGRFIHPVLNKPCGYPVDHFREIQPPINVSINGIIKQTSEA